MTYYVRRTVGVTVRQIFKSFVKLVDVIFLLAFVLVLALLVSSLMFRPGSTPIARYIFADGTTYIVASDAHGLVLARQAVTPRTAGTLVANVESLGLIEVYENGQPLPGMQSFWTSARWLPA